MVTAINRGTTNVVAMAGGKQAKCIVRVTADAIVPITPTEPTAPGTTPAPGTTTEPTTSPTPTPATTAKPSLSHTDVTLDRSKPGWDAFTLKVKDATGTPEFSSGAPGIATVDQNGNVKAVSAGTATITVTVDGETLKCIVRVK
ncbi:MAG: Ig-like domain-containing protein [Oscillospiraceae bacterium]|nr:Ig-like domain-containing protein [Oscillospiraceae bacterium]